jgi:hypothetical protein
VDPSHSRAAYAGFEAIPDRFDRRRVAADRTYVPTAARLGRRREWAQREIMSDILRSARRHYLAVAAEGFSPWQTVYR